jgi:CBS domain containing-hemolysin-like protein
VINSLDTASLLGLLAVVALVAANGFFVAAEFALVKVRSTRIDQLVQEGKGAARLVRSEIDRLDSYIAATQLGITLASLALGWLGEPVLAHLIEPLFKNIAGEASAGLAHSVAIAISFILITSFHIVLGELVPKSIALQKAESTALFVARPLFIFARIFRPFILMMNGVANFVVRLLGMQAAGEHASVHSVEELEMLVTQSREAGVLDNKEEVLLRRVFDFGDKSVNQIMMPRTEIVGVPTDVSLEQLVELASEERYTRFPVYEKTLDNIVGVVHVKDLFPLLRKSDTNRPFEVSQIMRRVYKLPETVLVEDLLTQMQKQQIHMTVIIDEYGGTAGIVTLEDILEELVGEVQDEFDTREEGSRPEVEVLSDGSSSVDGLMVLDDFSARFGVQFDETDYETIAGYVFGELGRTPGVGDDVPLGSYRLIVEEMDNLRIARLRVESISKHSDEPDENDQSEESIHNNSHLKNGKSKVA